MNYMERIEKYEKEFKGLSSLELARIYNDNRDIVDGRTVGWAKKRASQNILIEREDASYFDGFDEYKAYVDGQWID